MSTNFEPQHHVHLAVSVSIPDGLYIPIQPPLSEEERKGIGSEALCAGSELLQYLAEQLAGIGVTVQSIRINDSYTIEIIVTP